jgi:hypothetical protein
MRIPAISTSTALIIACPKNGIQYPFPPAPVSDAAILGTLISNHNYPKKSPIFPIVQVFFVPKSKSP